MRRLALGRTKAEEGDHFRKGPFPQKPKAMERRFGSAFSSIERTRKPIVKLWRHVEQLPFDGAKVAEVACPQCRSFIAYRCDHSPVMIF
jgi:hypothetical protein